MDESKLKFCWTVASEDGVWCDKSDKTFDTQKECYEDMLNHAIEKMKWNTEWEDLFSDGTTRHTHDGIVTTGEPIGYEMKVNADCISHTSYSGVYTYRIQRVADEWKPRFKCQDIICKGATVALVVCANENAKKPQDFGYQILIYGQDVPRYDEWTRDPDHWIPFENEGEWRKIGEVTADVENGEA